ncbi:catechol 2,3-dioxygenase-like lactoylglutathione lyase family enzyme [Marmoricola sp. URHA0025 HA25]
MDDITGPGRIDHVTTNVTDVERARTFYDAALGVLGLSGSVDAFGRVEYAGEGDGQFGFYGPPIAFHERAHVAFVAADRAAVDDFYRAAMAAGATSLDPPRERPEFGFYSAYVEDPDCNGIEVGVGLSADDGGQDSKRRWSSA